MQDVLIHVRDFQNWPPGVEYGVRLAAACQAAATGLCVCVAPGRVAPAYGPGVLVAAMLETARRRIRDAMAAEASFVDWALSLGVARASWLVASGDTDEALACAMARHDLLVLDRPEDQGTPAWGAARTILKTGAACIVVPHRASRFSPFERIAIGWNGSPEAMRAVHAALPFRRGKQVLLLRGEERRVSSDVRWITPFDIREYLERHHASVDERPICAPAPMQEAPCWRKRCSSRPTCS